MRATPARHGARVCWDTKAGGGRRYHTQGLVRPGTRPCFARQLPWRLLDTLACEGSSIPWPRLRLPIHHAPIPRGIVKWCCSRPAKAISSAFRGVALIYPWGDVPLASESLLAIPHSRRTAAALKSPSFCGLLFMLAVPPCAAASVGRPVRAFHDFSFLLEALLCGSLLGPLVLSAVAKMKVFEVPPSCGRLPTRGTAPSSERFRPVRGPTCPTEAFIASSR